MDGRSVAMIEEIELLFRQYRDYHQALRTPAPAPDPVAPGCSLCSSSYSSSSYFQELYTSKQEQSRTFNFSNGSDGGGYGGDGDGDGDGDNQPIAKRKDKITKRKSNKRRA
ncbi:hypothetical protein BGX27_003828, partial [Mortierella sp. AM989]